MISPMAPSGTPICARVVLTKSPARIDYLDVCLGGVGKSPTLDVPNLIDPLRPIVPRPDDEPCDAGLSPLHSNFNEVTDFHLLPPDPSRDKKRLDDRQHQTRAHQ